MFHRMSLRFELARLRVVQTPIGNSLDRGEPARVPEAAQKNSPCLSYIRHPYSTAVQVLNLEKVPRTVLAQQSISFFVLKHCYQNIQEVLQDSSTWREMRLTPRLGKSVHHLKNIKELQFMLGKYSYHVQNIQGNGFTLTQIKEMQAQNNS